MRFPKTLLEIGSILLFCCFFVVACKNPPACQPTYTLKGGVYEAGTNTPIQDAIVELPDLRVDAHTDKQGQYSILLPEIPRRVICWGLAWDTKTFQDSSNLWDASESVFKLDFSLEATQFGPDDIPSE